MSVALMVSALGALALSSGIALAAAQPLDMADHPAGDISRADAVAMAGRHFDRMDANKDGKADAADRDARHTTMAGAMFERVDANKDGSISRDEWNAGAAQLAARRDGFRHGLKMQRPAAMARMDADGDGAFTRADIEKRALEHFDRADTDRNGTVTLTEREAAHAALRDRMGRR